MSKTAQRNINTKQHKNTLAIIEGTSNTGEILKKECYRNACIYTELITSEYGKVKTAVLVSQDMSESDALKALNAWYGNTAGKRFAAWLSVNDFKECVSTSSFGLSEEQLQHFTLTLQINLGLQEFLRDAIRLATAKRTDGDAYGQSLYDTLKSVGEKIGADYNQVFG